MLVPFQKVTFALANTVAVLVALGVAFALDLERPYWAMLTVFIVANPIAGAVRSKAVYRFVGTFLGASVSLLLVPPLVHAPVLLCLATSAWVGACLYLSLLDRTPRSYLFLLAGYTAAIVGFSAVNTPEKIFDIAVSRVEEISLGLICAAIAHSVIFPQSVTAKLNREIEEALKTAGAWLSEALVRRETLLDVNAQARLATFVTRLHVLYTHVAFETSDVPRMGGVMHILQDRLALLLPRVSGVHKAVEAMASDSQVSPLVTRALESTAHWFRSGETPEQVRSHQYQATSSVEPATPTAVSTQGIRTDWQGLLEQNALTNLRELIAAFADANILATKLTNDTTMLPPHLEREAAAARRRYLHRDGGLALLSGLAGAGTTLAACLLWIEGSWPEGAVAAQFAAIGCSLAATLDAPAQYIRSAIIGILFALPFAALYEFAILPQIDGFPSLALVLSPAILLFSLMQSSERLGGAGLVLAIAFSGGLALQGSYQADFAAFVNSNFAEVVGLLVAAAMVLVFRTIDPVWNAARIARSGRKAVRRLATIEEIDLPAWTIQMFDRLGLVASRLHAGGNAGLAHEDTDGLRDLRVGLNIGAIRSARDDLGPASRSALMRVLQAVSSAYSVGFDHRDGRLDAQRTIEQGIMSVGAEAPSRAMLSSLAALVGLHLDLAPAGSRYAIAHTS